MVLVRSPNRQLRLFGQSKLVSFGSFRLVSSRFASFGVVWSRLLSPLARLVSFGLVFGPATGFALDWLNEREKEQERKREWERESVCVCACVCV